MVGSSKRLCHWGIKLYRLTQSKFHEIFHQVHSKPIKIDQEFCLLKYETTLIMYISVTSQFQCNVINTFRSNLYFSFVYLIASCYRAIIGIVGLLDVRCKVLF